MLLSAVCKGFIVPLMFISQRVLSLERARELESSLERAIESSLERARELESSLERERRIFNLHPLSLFCTHPHPPPLHRAVAMNFGHTEDLGFVTWTK
jgi:hypothetical protein